MYVYPKHEAMQYDGTNLSSFVGWEPGLSVSPSGDNMLCQRDGGEYIIEPGDWLVRRPGSLYYVKEADYAAWWGTA